MLNSDGAFNKYKNWDIYYIAVLIYNIIRNFIILMEVVIEIS